MVEYSLRNLRRVIKNPSYALGEVNRQATRFNAGFHHRFVPKRGVEVMDEDWDNLLILDGCRYDTFEVLSSLPGTLSRKRSLGSQSQEFMSANFEGRTLHDTVYVSANPYTSRFERGTFHNVVELYTDGWDPELETVTPETVVEATRTAHAEFPNKRLVVHFMQPHIPFIGEFGQTLSHTGLAHEEFDPRGKDGQKRYPVWSNLRFGFTDITIPEVWRAYAENLALVLDHVETLLQHLDGRTVVTADHGNLLGERIWPIPVRGYGHPPHVRVSGLVDVPWLEVEAESRRRVSVGQPRGREAVEEEVVEERLRDFGYMQ